MIKGIAHLAFNVKNMDKSINFYCNVLGFKKAFELKKDNGDPWIVYIKIAHNQFIELFYTNPEAEKRDSAVGYSHLCLEVSDIGLIADHLRGKGIILDVEPMQGKDGNYQCWAKDPDGNRIEFMQMDPNCLQNKK